MLVPFAPNPPGESHGQMARLGAECMDQLRPKTWGKSSERIAPWILKFHFIARSILTRYSHSLWRWKEMTDWLVRSRRQFWQRNDPNCYFKTPCALFSWTCNDPSDLYLGEFNDRRKKSLLIYATRDLHDKSLRKKETHSISISMTMTIFQNVKIAL